MSRITGTEFSEDFKMRVVSGMLVNGSLQVTWATGKESTSTLHWGFDSSVPNTIEDETLAKYHSMFFPTTLLDTFHFFRVKSTTKSAETGISPVYHVYVPGKVILGSDMPRIVELNVQLVTAISQQKTLLMPYAIATNFQFGDHPDVQPLEPKLAVSSTAKPTSTSQATLSDQSLSTPFLITIS